MTHKAKTSTFFVLFVCLSIFLSFLFLQTMSCVSDKFIKKQIANIEGSQRRPGKMFSEGELCHTEINVALCTVIHPQVGSNAVSMNFFYVKRIL